jgi:hypothetical protein
LSEAYFRDKLLNNSLQSKQDPGIAAQNLKIMQQSGMTLPGQTNNTYRQNQIAERSELKREEVKEAYGNNLAHFQNYYKQLLQLNPNNFSITKAVYCAKLFFTINLMLTANS